MGQALLTTWSMNLPQYQYIAFDPSPIPDSLIKKNITHYQKIESGNVGDYNAIILAVKPQIMSDICTKITPFLNPNTLIISIAAGQKIENFEKYFGQTHPIIRTMPNTPAAIEKGISVGVANKNVTEEQKKLTQTLFEKTGVFDWIEDENLMDAVTAVSGSGPAYVFYLIESLEKAAISNGLPPNLAQTLARQTVIGSAALAEIEHTQRPQTLRENVTSPGGTTEAALNLLMDGKFDRILDEAIKAAIKRGQELS